MGRFTRNLLEHFHNLHLKIRIFRPRTPPIDGNNDHHQDTPRGPPRVIWDERRSEKQPFREKLDGLARLRIRPRAIKFTSTKPRGSGGKAEVVQATLKLGKWDYEQEVAVKKLRYHAGMDKRKFSKEFVHEVDLMAGLFHENIVRLIGFVEDLENGTAWIVLSWEPNGNLSEFLATGEWEIPERLSLIKDTFAGIQYLHTRRPPICHGDLKSLNILVRSSYRATITDFGSARVLNGIERSERVTDEEHDGEAQENLDLEEAWAPLSVAATGNQLTLTGPAWSLRWAPPEVVNGRRPSLPSDVWAAGWICWEVMTNKLPFPELVSAGAITVMVVQGNVPRTREDTQLSQLIGLCSIMTDSWSFNPRNRPSIEKCLNDVKWMPSMAPLGGMPSDAKAPSAELLVQTAWIHYSQGRREQALSLLQRALKVASDQNDWEANARALWSFGHVYQSQSRIQEAEDSFIRAQEIYARIGDEEGEAKALAGLGRSYRHQSKYTEAERSYTRALDVLSRIGAGEGQAEALRGLGHIYRDQSKYTESEESYKRARDISARIGDDPSVANALVGLGGVYSAQHQFIKAQESYTMAQAAYARAGHTLGQAKALLGLGLVYTGRFKYTQAEEALKQAHDIYTRISDVLGQANALCRLGHLRRNQGHNAEAASFYEEARDVYSRANYFEEENRVSGLLAAISPGQAHSRRRHSYP